eukprot:bmy_01856T0
MSLMVSVSEGLTAAQTVQVERQPILTDPLHLGDLGRLEDHVNPGGRLDTSVTPPQAPHPLAGRGLGSPVLCLARCWSSVARPLLQVAPSHSCIGWFSDVILATILATKSEMCGQKFELKIDNVRFVGHPTLLQHALGQVRPPWADAGL